MVAVLNEAFVREHFPAKTRSDGGLSCSERLARWWASWATCAMRARHAALLRQCIFRSGSSRGPTARLMVRTPEIHPLVAPALRRAVLSADSSVAPFDVMTLDAAICGVDRARAVRPVPADRIRRAALSWLLSGSMAWCPMLSYEGGARLRCESPWAPVRATSSPK